MKWVEREYYRRIYVSSDGKIQGCIYRGIGSSEEWSAFAKEDKIGDYFGEENAKKAVEEKCSLWP